jgi:hypothetical protein
MPQSIKVQIRSVYGNDLVYPACWKAAAFAAIAGTKTLSSAVLLDIERLGFVIEVEPVRIFRAA